MFNPVQKGFERSAESVRYEELEPPISLSGFVHRFWEIKTEQDLLDDFRFHVLPDACVHIVFNLGEAKTAGITALRTTAQSLNLGKKFCFVGIRFLPGVWKGNPDDFVSGVVNEPYSGAMPLVELCGVLSNLSSLVEKLPVLSELVQQLVDKNMVAIDATTRKIVTQIGSIRSVADMAAATGLSTRQIQRTIKRTTGLSPHDLLKIIRLQQSFVQHYLDLYSDQPHYCLLYTSPSPRDATLSRMPSSA